MSKPYIHALSSVRRWGGVPEDYLPVHDLMDSSKAVFPDNRHRALTHTAWFIGTILERIFGHTLSNADGRVVSVRDVAEQHVLEDFGGIIPSAQDYLEALAYEPWMDGRGAPPPSRRRIADAAEARAIVLRMDD